jgi:hypothetical protein
MTVGNVDTDERCYVAIVAYFYCAASAIYFTEKPDINISAYIGLPVNEKERMEFVWIQA